jgi:hypothetical protein
MLFCQLAQARSLREISDGLQSCEGKLKHLGLESEPKYPRHRECKRGRNVTSNKRSSRLRGPRNPVRQTKNPSDRTSPLNPSRSLPPRFAQRTTTIGHLTRGALGKRTSGLPSLRAIHRDGPRAFNRLLSSA